jgi:hypothetical protein
MSRLRKRSLQPRDVPFPRTILAAFVVIIGLMLWMGVLSDPSGDLRTPGIGSILYVAAVIGLAALLAHADRHRDSAGKRGSSKAGDRLRRNTTAK